MGVELLILGDAPISRMVEHVKLAEANGYDTIWLADERFYREVYSCLSIFAAATQRVKLGPCVTDPFARHPALTAVAMATLDEISNGRAIFGLGAGVSGFAELGIERKKPPRAMRETIELVRKLLAGGDVDYQGEIVRFNNGHLSFKPLRADIPVTIASNGPLGQRTAGALCSGAIMEACASVEEVQAFGAEVAHGAEKAGRSAAEIPLTARLNCCIDEDGKAARDIMRPGVARILARGSMVFATGEKQGLMLAPEIKALAPTDAHYALGAQPYLPIVPHVTDRQVDAFTLAGTVDEVAAHVVSLRRAGVGNILIRPLARKGGTVEETIVAFGTQVMPKVERSARLMGFALHEAATLAEATALARTLGPDACFIAGGTDLVIQMKRRVRAPRALIDLSRIPDLAAIGKHGDVYTIGALTTHKTIESFPDFRAGPLAALREAARVIGGHQIRNRGTIGGNLANASPAADLAPPLLTLDALVVLRGPDGSRRIPLDEFLVGPRATLRAHDEAIEAVQFADLPPHSATAFLKAGRRKAMEISVVSVAAHLTLDPAGERCRVARIAIGSAAPTAVRARAAEALLEGSALDDARLDRVGQAALDAVAPLDDVRSSSEYRRLLVEVLVPRALRLCASRIADQAQ